MFIFVFVLIRVVELLSDFRGLGVLPEKVYLDLSGEQPPWGMAGGDQHSVRGGSRCCQKSKPRRLREDSSWGWRPSAWPTSVTKQANPGLNLYCAPLGQMDRVHSSILKLSWIFDYSLLGSSQHLLPFVSRPEPNCREPHVSVELVPL